jgi:hypothetical protein
MGSKTWISGAAAVAAAAALLAAPAQAGTSITFSVGSPGYYDYSAQPGYVYTQPNYVYTQPGYGYYYEQPAYVYTQPGYRHGHHRGYRRDQDRDGIPDRVDRDRDGDGVPNRYDRRPSNPYRR